MAATTRNPNVSNTAARYVAKAMCKVHPAQRDELLAEMIRAAEAGRRHIATGSAPGYPPTPDFSAMARDLLGVELAVAS